jgi:hypothetical protein
MNDLMVTEYPDHRTQAQFYGSPAEEDKAPALVRELDPNILKK